MGTEIVFVLILPIALICLLAAVFFWSRVAREEWGARSGPLRSYVPLFVGFGVSMISLALLTYIESNTAFTSLIQQGYYTEAERAIYLPERVVGQAIVILVLLLPAISFGVVPLTIWFIKRGRLTFKDIGMFLIIGWFALSLVGWIFSFAILTPPYSFPSFLGCTAIPVILYGSPIPVASIYFFRPRSEPENH